VTEIIKKKVKPKIDEGSIPLGIDLVIIRNLVSIAILVIIALLNYTEFVGVLGYAVVGFVLIYMTALIILKSKVGFYLQILTEIINILLAFVLIFYSIFSILLAAIPILVIYYLATDGKKFFSNSRLV
jgi:hypothetical protein